jgi:CheY-like chemotaxis protein
MVKSLHILYADDDEDDHIFFKEGLTSLKEFNCYVTSAYNGAEVLDMLLKRNKFRNVDIIPDLVVLDLNMPVIDGFGILKELRKNSRFVDLPVYILSVSDKEPDKERCRALGCTGFYTKPVNFNKLTSVIREILTEQNLKSI